MEADATAVTARKDNESDESDDLDWDDMLADLGLDGHSVDAHDPDQTPTRQAGEATARAAPRVSLRRTDRTAHAEADVSHSDLLNLLAEMDGGGGGEESADTQPLGDDVGLGEGDGDDGARPSAGLNLPPLADHHQDTLEDLLGAMASPPSSRRSRSCSSSSSSTSSSSSFSTVDHDAPLRFSSSGEDGRCVLCVGVLFQAAYPQPPRACL